MSGPKRMFWAAVVATVLAAVAVAYLQPAVMIQLGEQIWACFG